MRKKEKAVQQEQKLVKCPGCNLKLPEDDIKAQMAHMDKYHPDVIAKRRRGP